MKKVIHLTFIFFIILFSGLIIYNILQLNDKIEADNKASISSAQKELNQAVDIFNHRLQVMMDIAEEVANDITEQKLDSIQLHEKLQQVLKENKDIFGFGVGYEPYEFSKNQKLFAPFYIRPHDSIQLKQIEDSYDYTERDWYIKPLNEGKAWFEPPYIGEVSQKLMAEYSVPFFKKGANGEKIPIGIVYLDYSIEDLTKAIKNLDLGKSGYGFLCSRDGLLMSHPISEYVTSKKTIDDLAKFWKNE